MYERIKVKQLNSYIYLLDDNKESTGYLVLGESQALVVDTMTGYEDVKAVIREITDLPLMVVNTHGHPDHIYGNIYFDRAYIHPAESACLSGKTGFCLQGTVFWSRHGCSFRKVFQWRNFWKVWTGWSRC